ncbi:hypothetical protein LYNGBM3L_30970 [Moorena producens 3L]|uniref:Uncharacterized protein n=1 Tax=Moorena producens 3L TaxID=489825 RepID=F4XTS0_9CYAN|nr:hypothetical protein LYNGBM3L_30970 [Moorena producens 3L]
MPTNYLVGWAKFYDLELLQAPKGFCPPVRRVGKILGSRIITSTKGFLPTNYLVGWAKF